MEVVKLLFGSHLYGLSTPKSDKDYKGIFIPELDEILLQRAPKSINSSTGTNSSKNTNEDIDDEMFSLWYFLKLACDGETVAIDMLHSDSTISSSPEWEFLVENRARFYTKDMKSYVGYVKKQAAKYGIKGSRIAALEEAINVIKIYSVSFSKMSEEATLADVYQLLPIGEHSQFITDNNPRCGDQEFYEICSRKFQLTNKLDYTLTQLERIYDGYGHRAKLAKDNNGIDWKAMSHALRAGYQAYHIYADGDFSYPLPETEFLLKVKSGELDFLTEVQPKLDNLVDEVYRLAEASDLPSKVNRKFWDDWLLQVYKERILS